MVDREIKTEFKEQPFENVDKISQADEPMEDVVNDTNKRGSGDKASNGSESKKPLKKKKEDKLCEEIEIPEGMNAEIVDDVLIMKKDGKELKRKLNSLVDINVDGNKVIICVDRVRRIEKRLFGTFKAHVRNMIKGFEEDFVFKLKIANVHFPMSVSFDKATNELVVKNFLGEKKDRRIKLVDGVDVNVDKEDIEVKSHDIEKAGTAATQIEKGAKVRNKDRRIYQDGIFISVKPGRVYL